MKLSKHAEIISEGCERLICGFKGLKKEHSNILGLCFNLNSIKECTSPAVFHTWNNLVNNLSKFSLIYSDL